MQRAVKEQRNSSEFFSFLCCPPFSAPTLTWGGGPNRRMREKIQDEYDAMMICREKVAQRGLPMQIVDAEYQWLVSFLLSASTLYSFSLQFLLTFFLFLFFYFLSYPRDRRKLTFYFKADKRVDFRDLTKENFRIFKSRIWMSMVSKDGEY